MLCGDDDYAVGSTRTIDRCRSSILEHLHTLNIVHVERVEGCGGRHTVDNKERILRRIERTDTTNANRTGANWRTVGGDSHARHLALKRTHRICVGCRLEVFGAYYRYRTGQVGLALHLITRYYHFAENLRVVLKHNLEVFACLHLLVFATYIRDDKSFAWLHVKFEVAVDIRHCTHVRGALNLNRCTDDGLTGVVGHCSTDAVGLSICA